MSTKAQLETIEKRVKKLLAQFAPLEQERLEICTVRDAAVKREREKFDKACAPLNQLANEQLEPVNQKLSPILREIEGLLTAAVDEKGRALFKTADSRDARAEVKQTVQRQVDPKELLELVSEAERTPAFWECLDVLIGKTSQFLGATKLDELAEPDYKKPKVTTSLR